ncbi:unnamed protein product (macronuclear) [Paramecium tetraurelia]|uniref:B box-type domain-containing protein n=1 Tax=Paramecium tetraurelia TaxID=5888 RepID=A0C938_PARTE|nr:uncharacterized protein GSPATT00006611001 [Paramecium tetraurelia]CAK67305.1 unnamed protein product [Paramecium tetraurelia]|eukprot:XP_001434702.1 hypothetical protein (macronuclear) [Paramecium tetraurelia strain d4-2]
MEFQCCQCQTEFNSANNSPYVLPSCGHSVCYKCVEQYICGGQQLKCKEDGIECNVHRDQKCFPQNQSILTMLKKRQSSAKTLATYQTPDDEHSQNSTKEMAEHFSEKSTSQFTPTEAPPKTSICQLHQKELELICQEDGQCICVNCALFGPHKFHNYLPIDQFLKQIELTVNEISCLYKQIQNERNNKEQLEQLLSLGFHQQLCCIKSKIDLYFSDLNKQIDEIKMQTLYKINQAYENSQEIILNKIDDEFSLLQIEADQWLNQASYQLSQLVEESQQLKFRKFDQIIINSGQTILKQFNLIKESITTSIDSTQKSHQIQVPIQVISNYISQLMGLNTNKYETNKQDTVLLLPSNLSDKSQSNDQSDFLVPERQITEEAIKVIEKKPLKIDVGKLKRNSGVFSPSQYPTQPTSPAYDVAKQINFNSVQSQFSKQKERSATLSNCELLETSQILVQKQSKFSNTIQNSNQKQPKKFTNNQKMNEKLSQTLTVIHQDKNEIIDLSQIDFNDQIIQILGEYLKGTQNIKVLKLSKCLIVDDLFHKLILNLAESKIHTLHLQQNLLTEKSLDHILVFLKQHPETQLRLYYMNQNSIIASKAKKKMDELKKYGVQISL